MCEIKYRTLTHFLYPIEEEEESSGDLPQSLLRLLVMLPIVLILGILVGVSHCIKKPKTRRSSVASSHHPTQQTSITQHPADSPPDYVTCVRQKSQPNSSHTNLSYVTFNPVSSLLYEVPPPSYSDVYPADSTPYSEINSESPPEYSTIDTTTNSCSL